MTSNGAETAQLERVGSGYLNMVASGGAPMIDMAASPGNMQISQEVSGLTQGTTYAIHSKPALRSRKRRGSKSIGATS
ncbi:hypothetical protein [Paradevosia shaoguanensis]|uniref:hypothetical protein n=1 Tax=Paradevosia shaoguanensis TaxID=1335043 RepID=UPI0019346171|nr:hypothetical protein [Paradevosia shaoguanensis]